jgi:hypothetical protein
MLSLHLIKTQNIAELVAPCAKANRNTKINQNAVQKANAVKLQRRAKSK